VLAPLEINFRALNVSLVTTLCRGCASCATYQQGVPNLISLPSVTTTTINAKFVVRASNCKLMEFVLQVVAVIKLTAKPRTLHFLALTVIINVPLAWEVLLPTLLEFVPLVERHLIAKQQIWPLLV